jgi:PAS domain S-box-containing protein
MIGTTTTVVRRLLEWLGLAAAYYCVGRLGLLLAIPPGYATATWPAAGIAVTAVLLRGYGVWPGILLGSFAINVTMAGGADTHAALLRAVAIAASIGAGASAQAVLAAWLVRRTVGFPTRLIRELDIIAFLTLAGPVASLLGATWGVLTLLLAGAVDRAAAPFSWWTWWTGDTVGVLVVAPMVAIWTSGAGQPHRRRLAVSVPLALTFAIAVTLFVYASRWEQARLTQDFNRRTDEIAREVQREIDAARSMLHSIQGLYESSEVVTRAEFRAFVQHLLSSDVRIMALGWVRRLPNADRLAFEAGEHPDDVASWYVKERAADGTLIRADERAEYYPIDYIEPRNGNESALGFDIASDPPRRRALDLARDSATVVATSGIRIVQSQPGKSALGVLLIAPIYRHGLPRNASVAERRANLVGAATSLFRIDDMLAATLGIDEVQETWVRLSDGDGTLAQPTLFDDRPKDVSASGVAERTLLLPIAGRRWMLEFWPTPAYRAARRSWESWSVLAAGSLFTGILGALLLVVTGRTAVVEDLVVQRTSELEKAADHLRTSEARTRLVLETVHDAFIAMDEAGTITEWNREAEQTFGWSRTEAIGRTVAETIIPPRLRAAHREGLRRFLATGHGSSIGPRIELSAIDAAGREFPVEVTITPVRFGDVYSFNAFVHDITERTIAAHELEVAKNAAESANQAKSEFLASMSHELRTPMNSIIGFTQLLLRGRQASGSSEDVDALQTVHRNAKHLLTLINQILDLSKVEAGRVELVREPFDLAMLVRQIAEESRPLIGEKPIVIAVEADHPARVDADPTRVRQIVTNLVGNALKYTERGRVDVAVATADDPALGPVARVSIRDTGPGITREDQALLFERFVRLDTPGTRREGGTGLGLSLARELAHMHGGRIEVASDGQSGSEFTLVLPLGVVRAQAGTGAAARVG